MQLTAFTIHGIFDKHDISLDLTIRPLFIVGPNGSGKSTALTIFHCVITGQWQRLQNLPFTAVSMNFGDRYIFLVREEFETIARFRQMFFVQPNKPLPHDWGQAQRIARRRIGPASSSPPTLVEGIGLENRYEALAAVFNFAEFENRDKVLFYPTYRRIERDLSDLFEVDDTFNEYGFDFDDSIRRRFDSYGEVIGFGGQDIRRLIEKAVSAVENIARQALNEHSIKFLGALNKADALQNRDLRSAVLDGDRVERLIDKINTFAPGSIDTNALRQNLDDLRAKIIRGKQGRLRINEDILIYYVAELMGVLERIDANARPIHQFCDYISAYLRPNKLAVFDEKDFSVHIRSIEGGEVDLDSLSSGEKQILSLFAFMIFSPPPRGSILIIDEPELSLSVSWQKRLIGDLISTDRPYTIVAATHSPFIFERFRLKDVVSLGEI